MPTLLEIATERQAPLSTGLFRAVQTMTPALSHFDARTAPGRKFKTLALTGLPTAGGFKNFGEGFTSGKATLAIREFEAKMTGGKVEAERITANDWDRENSATGETYFSLQLQSRFQTELKHLEKVIFLGTDLDAKAFPGLKQLTPFSGGALALTDDPGATDYVKSVVNAAGTTSNTASSVYSVVYGTAEAQLVLCNDGGGEMFTATEMVSQHQAPDSNNPEATLLYDIVQMYGFFGLSIGGMNQTQTAGVPTQYSVRRLCNVTAQTDKGVDDHKLEALVLSHGDNVMPSVLFMNGRSGRQWAASRNPTGVTLFLGGPGEAKNNAGPLRAKRPTDFDGIPVVYTSAITSTEAIEV